MDPCLVAVLTSVLDVLQALAAANHYIVTNLSKASSPPRHATPQPIASPFAARAAAAAISDGTAEITADVAQHSNGAASGSHIMRSVIAAPGRASSPQNDRPAPALQRPQAAASVARTAASAAPSRAAPSSNAEVLSL